MGERDGAAVCCGGGSGRELGPGEHLGVVEGLLSEKDVLLRVDHPLCGVDNSDARLGKILGGHELRKNPHSAISRGVGVQSTRCALVVALHVGDDGRVELDRPPR